MLVTGNPWSPLLCPHSRPAPPGSWTLWPVLGFASAVCLSQLAPPARPVSGAPSVYGAHTRCSLDTAE